METVIALFLACFGFFTVFQFAMYLGRKGAEKDFTPYAEDAVKKIRAKQLADSQDKEKASSDALSVASGTDPSVVQKRTVSDRLLHLADLHKKGLITDDAYSKRQSEILMEEKV